MTPERQRVLDASSLLEAIRPAADRALGGVDPADDPIRHAWDLARAEMRRACAAYVEAVKQ